MDKGSCIYRLAHENEGNWVLANHAICNSPFSTHFYTGNGINYYVLLDGHLATCSGLATVQVNKRVAEFA